MFRLAYDLLTNTLGFIIINLVNLHSMGMGKTVAYHTLGCKLNFSETSSIQRDLEGNGWNKVAFEDGADLNIINTCSVTHNADKECKSIVNKAKRMNSESKVVIIGCYAQLKPKEIIEMNGVDLVLGTKEKFNIVQHIHQLEEGIGGVVAGDIEEVNFFKSAYSSGERTRAFLKVQDGCDYPCTYCTIPLARGKSRSDSIEGVVKNALEIVAKGIKEIVLTGINLGDFGKLDQVSKKPIYTFIDLLKKLDEVDGLERIRISSIEPNLLSDEIIDFVATSKKIMPHFHVPLQSGSDLILRKMKRRYLTDLYVSRVKNIKEKIPHACIGVDVIVGFPGETEAEFITTYNFLNELDVSYLHVFSYSERPNTPAIHMDGKVSPIEKADRSKRLRNLSIKKRSFFYEQFINSDRKVLFENYKDGNQIGFTDNYIKVELKTPSSLSNEIHTIQLNKVVESGNVLVELI